MSFSRPSLSTLRARIGADLSANLLDGAPLKSRSVLGVLAFVWAGACHLMYGALAWYFKQFWAESAEKDYLEIKAKAWGVKRKSAARASGLVTFSGLGRVSAGAVLRSPSGGLYAVDADTLVPRSGRVTAVDAGSAGNLAEGEQLTFVKPVEGVNSTALSRGLSGGADAESDDSLRARLLATLQAPPHGGSAADYVTWAREVPGVTRAWCYPLYLGLGTVGVTFVTDDEASIVPSAELVARVQAYIDDLRPVTAEVTVFAPKTLPVDMTIRLLPNTAAVQEAVRSELGDLFAREAEPGVTLLLSHIREAVSLAAGESDHVLISPTANIVPENGVIPILGSVTFMGVE